MYAEYSLHVCVAIIIDYMYHALKTFAQQQTFIKSAMVETL